MPDIEDLVGVALTAGISGGGMWFIITLMVRFQRDFLERYRVEVVETKAELDKVETERETLAEALRACREESHALKLRLQRKDPPRTSP